MGDAVLAAERGPGTGLVMAPITAPNDPGPTRPRPRLRGLVAMWLYQSLFLCCIAIYAPVLLWRLMFEPGYRRAVRQRMGAVEIVRRGAQVVWIHGVSVGEIKAAANIIQRLREHAPGLQIVLSATTQNGNKVARLEHPELQVVFYPLDFGPFPARALDRIRPSCVMLMELEIWPNFLQAASRRGIPVVVINGRISERTFRGYRRARGMLPQLDVIRFYCVQDHVYRQRLLDLGVEPDRVFVTGNMKYDSVVMGRHGEQGRILRRWLAPDARLVLVAGSTHADEERWLCEAVDVATAGRRDAVRLVLVPRHPERAAAVAEQVRDAGRVVVRWSEIDPAREPLADGAVVLVDTIGQLQTFYAACEVAFVGGSLVPHGGQNMLEPAALGRAVLFGPHTWNFRADVDLLLQAGAALQVKDRAELALRLGELIGSAALREQLGGRARAVIAANQGATQRTLEILRPVLGC